MSRVEAFINDLVERICSSEEITQERLAKLIYAANKHIPVDQHISKKVLSEYVRTAELMLPTDVDTTLQALLQMKPRRTQSGVASISIMTKPWPCEGNCLYCPRDVRMPKSYLHDEPACQRAELNFFDPYLQVSARLSVLENMGHPTDKVELLVLGGSWHDYPQEYRDWFLHEAYQALQNSADAREKAADARRRLYTSRGLTNEREVLQARSAQIQEQVTGGALTYNEAIRGLYEPQGPAECVVDPPNNVPACLQGLSIETRPEHLTDSEVQRLRKVGCTRVQLGVQSLDPQVLRLNNCANNLEELKRAIATLRTHGFLINLHFMVNLYGSTPELDKHCFDELMSDPAFMPDELKIYPCVLIQSSDLRKQHEAGLWKPYSEAELLEVLDHILANTPPHVRISRMIRDFSAHDISAGNKKSNLRQVVTERLLARGVDIYEMRHREILDPKGAPLHIERIDYETAASHEIFLQLLNSKNQLAAFARFSFLSDGQARVRELRTCCKKGSLGPIAVAFSGGADSTLLLKLCQMALGESVVALTVATSLTPAHELLAAKEFCNAHDIKHEVIELNDAFIEPFAQNPPNRCYICKKALFTRIIAEAKALGCTCVVDGTNADDLKDYRPGMKALEELDVRSPLKEAGLTKREIHALSHALSLPTAGAPSCACLATRVAYGESLTPDLLKSIDQAEDFLRSLGFKQVRVRTRNGDASIEVYQEEISRLTYENVLAQVKAKLADLGFKKVEVAPEGYKTGSMNQDLSPESLVAQAQ